MIDLAAMAEGVRARRRPMIARALNLVEDRRPAAQHQIGELLTALRSGSANAQRVGITGPPGVGKSTLTGALTLELRKRQRSIGVVAVDPSSIESGGSLLGDRARMSFDPGDDHIFVRSLATGGDPGGLAWAAHASVRVLSAAFDNVLIETTGVGQSETDIRHVADTVVLVVQPGSGDTLQFLKAGVMEIPDVLVVNKSDQESLARRALSDLQSALGAVASALGKGHHIPIVSTSATHGAGVDQLADAIATRFESTGAQERQRKRMASEIQWTLSLFLRQHGQHGVEIMGGNQALLQRADELLVQLAPPLVAEELSKMFLSQLMSQLNTD